MEDEREIGDILRSQSASDVLFALICGKRSPREISDAIGDSSPAVIKQLWKLRRAGIVKLGEKRGKFQNYKVLWGKLTKEAVYRLEGLVTAMVLASLKNDVKKYEMLENLRLRLSKNKLFRGLFKAFLEEEAKRRETTDIYLITTNTFQDAINKFEKFLPRFYPFLAGKNEKAERKELLLLLKNLCEATEEANEFEAIPLKNALKRMNLIK